MRNSTAVKSAQDYFIKIFRRSVNEKNASRIVTLKEFWELNRKWDRAYNVLKRSEK